MLKLKNDLTGQTFGRLFIKKFLYRDKNSNATYLCICSCGNEKIVHRPKLIKGETKSCGCLWKERHKPRKDSPSWKGYGDLSGRLFYNIKRSAKVRHINFNLNMKFLWELFLNQEKKCAISGVNLKFESKFYSTDRTASLDRIDSSKGYEEGNVQWIHKDINQMKMDMSDQEFIQWCRIIAKNNPEKVTSNYNIVNFVKHWNNPIERQKLLEMES